MTDNLRGVKAESRDDDCSYYRQRLGPLGGIPDVMTHRASGMRQLRALAEENDGIATQLGATDEAIDVCGGSACGHWERVGSSVWR